MYPKRIFLSLFLLLLSFTAATAQGFNRAKMDSLLDAITANNKGMGSLAISHNGVPVYQRAIGYEYVSGGQSVDANVKTKYRIGSITKMFTAVMIFQLMEEGKLSLNTTLATFYPQIANSKRITIAQMLQHRSGLHNFTNDAGYTSYMSAAHTRQDMLAIIAGQPTDFDPDTKAAYSNTNFVLLGYIIEKITQRAYSLELRQRVTSRLGLTDTYYGGKITQAKNEANSYLYLNGFWQPGTETDMSVPGGAGAIVSTPADLDKFIEALFAGRLISKAHLALMQTFRDGYGMAMFEVPFYERKGYGHTGGIDGFTSQLIYFPADHLAIAYICNGAGYSVNDIMIGALSIYFKKPYLIPSFKTLTLTSRDLDKYLGVYSAPNFPLKITIGKHGHTLTAEATGQATFELEATKPDIFEFGSAGIVLDFNAAIGEMTFTQGGAKFVLKREE